MGTGGRAERRKPQSLKVQRQGISQPHGVSGRDFPHPWDRTRGPPRRRLPVAPRAPGRGGREQRRQGGGLWLRSHLPGQAWRHLTPKPGGGWTWATTLQPPLPVLPDCKGHGSGGAGAGGLRPRYHGAPPLRALATSGLTLMLVKQSSGRQERTRTWEMGEDGRAALWPTGGS